MPERDQAEPREGEQPAAADYEVVCRICGRLIANERRVFMRLTVDGLKHNAVHKPVGVVVVADPSILTTSESWLVNVTQAGYRRVLSPRTGFYAPPCCGGSR